MLRSVGAGGGRPPPATRWDGKRGVGHRPQATAPILDSTECMVRPRVARGFVNLADAVLHQCIRPLIGACCAPGHHGYQPEVAGKGSTGAFDPTADVGCLAASSVWTAVRAIPNCGWSRYAALTV